LGRSKSSEGVGKTAHALLGTVAFISIVILYGSGWVAVKFSDRELEPFWGATLRMLVSAVALLAVFSLLHGHRPKGRALTASLAYGALGMGMNYVLLYWALVTVTASLGSVIYATIPLVTLFLAVMLRLERFRWIALGGAALASAGICLIFAEELGVNPPTVSILAVGLAALCTSGGAIIIKLTPTSDAIGTNVFGLWSGTAVLFLSAIASGNRIVLPTAATTWLALGWLVMSSTLGSVLWVWLISKWPVSRVSYYAVLSPLVAFVVATAFASETISLPFLVGSGCVLVGVYLGAIRARPVAVPPS
jgi:drug/metabolite transporter (DMT)-like permease